MNVFVLLWFSAVPFCLPTGASRWRSLTIVGPRSKYLHGNAGRNLTFFSSLLLSGKLGRYAVGRGFERADPETLSTTEIWCKL